MRLFLVLLTSEGNGTSSDGDEEVLLDSHTLAACMNQEAGYAAGNVSTESFLESFKRQVLPEFEWTEYVPGVRVRATRLTHVREVVDHQILKLWQEERAAPIYEVKDRVYAESGASFRSPSNQSRVRRHRAAAMQGYDEHAPTELSGRLWRLLESTPHNSFSSLRERAQDAWGLIPSLESDTARASARSDLQAIYEEPMQHYRFSPYTVRLSGANPGVATVARPLRRALLSDCYELDLASSQLAIGAREFGTPMLYDFLEREEPFWPYLVDYMGLPYSYEAKQAVKQGTYGLVYGAGDSTITSEIRREYARRTGERMSERLAKRFFDCPLVKEMKDARDAQLEAIHERGYVIDAFGRRLEWGQMMYGDGLKRTVRGAEAARSLLAQKAQAREMWLLEPVIALSETEARKGKNAEWRILCWQHDGFSVRFRREPQRFLMKLMHAVEERASRYGYPTRLEVEAKPQTILEGA